MKATFLDAQLGDYIVATVCYNDEDDEPVRIWGVISDIDYREIVVHGSYEDLPDEDDSPIELLICSDAYNVKLVHNLSRTTEALAQI